MLWVQICLVGITWFLLSRVFSLIDEANGDVLREFTIKANETGFEVDD